MDFISQNTLATDPDTITRVRQAILGAAIAISAESDQTANHARRIALAYSVLHSPEQFAKTFAFGLATLAVNDAPTDAQISTAVAALWNAYAGSN